MRLGEDAMMTRGRAAAACSVAVACWLAAGCANRYGGPSSSFAAIGSGACAAEQRHLAGLEQEATESAAAGAIVGVLLGALLGAALAGGDNRGAGAAAGAAAGGLLGGATGYYQTRRYGTAQSRANAPALVREIQATQGAIDATEAAVAALQLCREREIMRLSEAVRQQRVDRAAAWREVEALRLSRARDRAAIEQVSDQLREREARIDRSSVGLGGPVAEGSAELDAARRQLQERVEQGDRRISDMIDELEESLI